MPSLWDLVEKPKEEPQKEIQEETPEVVEAAPVEENIEKPKTTKAAKTTAKKETKKVEEKKYLFPFQLYSNDHYYEIDYIFEEGKEYTFKEICTAMLNHKKYEFDGELVEAYIEEDNVLTFTQKQFKKG